MKNKIILIAGYCATGKSTFAHALGERLQLPCFNKDTIKEILGDGFGPENAGVREKNSAVTFALMLHIAERFLRAGKGCILESNFRLPESGRLRALFDQYGCACLTFLFQGEPDALYARYARRDRAGARHWVHRPAGQDPAQLAGWQRQFGLEGIAVGETVAVDATSFETVNYKELFAAAERFIEE